MTNWLECASNHYAQSTNVTNSIFLSDIIATPIDRAHYWAGRDHQHYRSISVHKSVDAKCTQGMCSSFILHLLRLDIVCDTLSKSSNMCMSQTLRAIYAVVQM